MQIVWVACGSSRKTFKEDWDDFVWHERQKFEGRKWAEKSKNLYHKSLK